MKKSASDETKPMETLGEEKQTLGEKAEEAKREEAAKKISTDNNNSSFIFVVVALPKPWSGGGR